VGARKLKMESDPLVLVVDDNEDNRDIYAASLRHKGYSVEVASDGEEALAIARRLRPAIVVMDLGMPGMDGWDAIAALRATPETRNTYVIVVSGFADTTSRKRAREAGCDEFIAKPCLPKVLIERIADVLKSKR
jgi:two-component system, cell cycle response regulator DivK